VPSHPAGSRFDADPNEQDHGRHESDEADDADSGCELEGQQRKGKGGKQIDEQRSAGGGAGRYVARQAHHFSPLRR
jgi:hypothetical protein